MNMALPFLFAQPAVTADLTQVYAIIPFLNILFTYGLETAYFRFSQAKEFERNLFSTLGLSLLSSTILFTTVLYLLNPLIAKAADLTAHPEYITWMSVIIFFDTLATLPFAMLRQENRPRKYAFVRIAGIGLNVLIVLFFLGFLPGIAARNPGSLLANLHQKDIGIGYYLIGNMCGSAFTFLLLRSEWMKIRFRFDPVLWKKIMSYSTPLIIVGLGGMINDMLSRLVYQHVVTVSPEEAKHQLGVFANLYRLAVLITIMIQAFRMAAEPFFFNRSKEANVEVTYARVMKFFVLACCFMFLGIGLYLDELKWLITLKSKAWGEGMNVVLLLAMGNIFLGIYYNLSIWYKLTNRNWYGAAITIAGAIITVGLNLLLIPKYEYWGAAFATFSCYLFMMLASYYFGQKFYPVPYAWKKLLAYLGLVTIIVLAHRLLSSVLPHLWMSFTSATVLLIGFGLFVLKAERKELAGIPFLNKFISND
jgi:O-antigen/teichoic acid export membrane protein